MDDLSLNIQMQLIGNRIRDWCQQKPDLIFNPADCSGYHCIRFSSPVLQWIIQPVGRQSGFWKNGQFLMVEIRQQASALQMCCVLSGSDLNRRDRQTAIALMRDLGIPEAGWTDTDALPEAVDLKIWSYPSRFTSDKDVVEVLEDFYQSEWQLFEDQLMVWQKCFSAVGEHRAKTTADAVDEMPDGYDAGSDAVLLEGHEVLTWSQRFERNPKARRQCIEAHGSRCAICGFDFGSLYGTDFKGVIEVHHIIPLHSIRSDYVVNPVRDLIPVCSNCHTALHHKPGGVYTPEELRAFIQQASPASAPPADS